MWTGILEPRRSPSSGRPGGLGTIRRPVSAQASGRLSRAEPSQERPSGMRVIGPGRRGLRAITMLTHRHYPFTMLVVIKF